MAVSFHGYKQVGYFSPAGEYFEVTEKVWTDKRGVRTINHSPVMEGARSVPVRPSASHEWDGMRWIENKNAVPVVSVPDTILRRQFFHLLALDGVIEKEEALAAVKTGELPPAIVEFIGSLDEQEKFAAEMLFSGATDFDRSHPLVAKFGEMQGMSPDEIDDLWVRASRLN